MNDFVEKWFGTALDREWYSVGGENYSSFKVEASQWIEDNISLLNDLQEMIDELPDEEQEEYPDNTLSQTVINKEES